MAKKTAIDKMYEKLKMTGHKSSLALTVKVMDGKQERYFYDIRLRSVSDPRNVLSRYIVTGVVDEGRNVSDGHGGSIWMKKFKETTQPRFLEDFIKHYGKRYVSIHEYGTAEVYKETIEKLLT